MRRLDGSPIHYPTQPAWESSYSHLKVFAIPNAGLVWLPPRSQHQLGSLNVYRIKNPNQNMSTRRQVVSVASLAPACPCLGILMEQAVVKNWYLLRRAGDENS